MSQEAKEEVKEKVRVEPSGAVFWQHLARLKSYNTTVDSIMQLFILFTIEKYGNITLLWWQMIWIGSKMYMHVGRLECIRFG